MRRVLSTALAGHAGAPVTIAGWVHRRRLLKSVAFVLIRDAAGLAQVVVTDPAVRTMVERALGEETVVTVTGTARANPVAPGGVELVEPAFTVLGEPAERPPFDLYRPHLTAGLASELDNAPVALRHPRSRDTHRIAAAAVAGFRRALDQKSFVEIQSPRVVAAATEGGAGVFEIDWFGRPAYLAQSPQFYKQIMVGVFERVYEVGPVFRAEPHDTARHLAQYTSLDAELGFIADHTDVMAVLRDTVAAMLSEVEERAAGALARLEVTLPAVPRGVPVVHFTEAVDLLTGAGVRPPAEAGEPDLAPAEEVWLGRWAQREHGSEFLFVTGYPLAKRPFYTHPDPLRPGHTRGFDLLFRGLELVTGGQRLHRHGDYLAALAERGVHDLAPFAGYLDAFRHGMPPHGGFAIGLERFVARLLGLANVRQATLFPRDVHRLTP